MSQPNSFSLTVRGVSVARANRPVLADVDLTLTERSRVAIVGPNGVGKSTLLQVLAGALNPDAGTVVATPPSTTVGLLDQELQAGHAGTVRELIAGRLGIAAAELELTKASEALGDRPDPDTAIERHDTAAERYDTAAERYDTAAERYDTAAERYDTALQRFLSLGASDFEARLEAAADHLGLTDRALDTDPTVLSGGEAERVGLAMVILSRFDLTLLDEPTNNLDLEGLGILEDWVATHRGGLVMVSHDRAFLERTVSTVAEIHHHDHTVAEFNGGWQAFLDERERAAAQAQARYQEYVGERGRLAARAQTQQEWAAQGLSRAKKNPADGDKFRKNFQIAQTEHLAGKAKATKKAIDRLDVVEKPWEQWQLQFTIPDVPRSSDIVAALDKAVLRRGDFTLGPIDVEIRWADRVAIVGRNGSGKSTLIEALLGRLTPESGSAKLGSGVVVGELGQRRDDFSAKGDRTLLRAFQDGSDLPTDQARSVLAKFGLDSEVIGRQAETLSPGERTRARLALFQATGVNLLVLDEPTNHLDLEAIEQLESAIASFNGTLILVSHDRRLLEQVTLSRTLEL